MLCQELEAINAAPLITLSSISTTLTTETNSLSLQGCRIKPREIEVLFAGGMERNVSEVQLSRDLNTTSIRKS